MAQKASIAFSMHLTWGSYRVAEYWPLRLGHISRFEDVYTVSNKPASLQGPLKLVPKFWADK